jgi:hypothetical protein
MFCATLNCESSQECKNCFERLRHSLCSFTSQNFQRSVNSWPLCEDSVEGAAENGGLRVCHPANRRVLCTRHLHVRNLQFSDGNDGHTKVVDGVLLAQLVVSEDEELGLCVVVLDSTFPGRSMVDYRIFGAMANLAFGGGLSLENSVIMQLGTIGEHNDVMVLIGLQADGRAQGSKVACFRVIDQLPAFKTLVVTGNCVSGEQLSASEKMTVQCSPLVIAGISLEHAHACLSATRGTAAFADFSSGNVAIVNLEANEEETDEDETADADSDDMGS